MFSDSRAPAPGEQRGFKPHAPHFIPWLRNSLKPHHSSDLGLKGPYKSSSEVRNNLTQLERAKGIGLFSIQGKDRAKKGELRCNRVGMARMLPVVLRGHHIRPGNLSKQRKDSPPSWNQSPELHHDSNMQICPGERPQGLSNSPSSAQDNHTIVKNASGQQNQSQTDRTSTSVGKFGLLAGSPSAPVSEETNCKLPVVSMEDRRGKVWDYGSNTTYRQRDIHLSSWLNSDTRGPTERKHGFTSSFSYIKQNKSRISKSHKDLTTLREPSVECFNGPLNGAIFSTEVPLKGLGGTTTLRGPRTARSSLEHIGILEHNQTWTHHSLTNEGGQRRKGPGCCRKVVRNQIKRVVDNLEQVLGALRDVQQEMKEVVQQIDYLTSAIDLNEEEPHRTTGNINTELANDSSCPSDTSYGEVTVGSTYERSLEPEKQPGTAYLSGTLSRDHHSRQQSPPNVLLCQATSKFSSDRSGNIQYSSNMGSSSRQGGTLQYINNVSSSNPTLHDLSLSLQRSLPVRPPTPGLSPLTVNLHPSISPDSQPPSTGPYSSIKVSPPTLLSQMSQIYPTPSPSVIIENRMGFYQTPQSDNPSARKFSSSSTQPPSASCPPTNTLTQPVSNGDKECQASSAVPIHRPSQVSTAPSATAKTPIGQGRKGRKPPPYPHNKLSEHESKKMKEARKAPPYPEKRRLLSTTV